MRYLTALMLITGCVTEPPTTTWQIDLPRASVTIVGDATCPTETLTRITLTVQDPDGSPVIVEDPTWSCVSQDDGVLCAKVASPGDQVTLVIEPTHVQYTYTFADNGACIYEFSD